MKFVQLKKEYKGRPIGERISVDPDDAKLLVNAGIADLIADDPLPGLFQKSLEGVLANFDKAISTALDGLLQQFAAAQAKSRRHQIPAIFGDGNIGDPKRTFGAFLVAVRKGDMKTLEEMGSQFVEWESHSQ